MLRRAGAAALVIFLLALPELALGDAELTAPQPRSPGGKTPSGSGGTNGVNGQPGTASDGCGFGDELRTSQPTVVTVGSQLQVNWKETVNHTGWYELQFSPANDSGWVRLKLVADTNDAGVSPSTPRPWSTVVTLPSTPTSTGTLRLIQWATNSAQPPAVVALHYSCADLALIPPAGGSTPPPDPGGGRSGGGSATGAAPPSNVFSLGASATSAARGTATLTVRVPGPGRLVVLARAGKLRVARATRSVTRAGQVKLTITPSRAAKRRLRKKRRLRTAVRLTYTPTGGTPRTRTRSVTLRLGRRR